MPIPHNPEEESYRTLEIHITEDVYTSLAFAAIKRGVAETEILRRGFVAYLTLDRILDENPDMRLALVPKDDTGTDDVFGNVFPPTE